MPSGKVVRAWGAAYAPLSSLAGPAFVGLPRTWVVLGWTERTGRSRLCAPGSFLFGTLAQMSNGLSRAIMEIVTQLVSGVVMVEHDPDAVDISPELEYALVDQPEG